MYPKYAVPIITWLLLFLFFFSGFHDAHVLRCHNSWKKSFAIKRHERDIHKGVEALVMRLSDSGANSPLFYQTSQRSFYSSTDYFNSPIRSHMVNCSVKQVLHKLIWIALDGIYIMVQIYHVRMYGPKCSRCTYLCLSILLCRCPVQLDYEVAFNIRSTNRFFHQKKSVLNIGKSSIGLIYIYINNT